MIEVLWFSPFLLESGAEIVPLLLVCAIGSAVVILHAREEWAEGIAATFGARANSQALQWWPRWLGGLVLALPPCLLSLFCIWAPWHSPETASWWLSIAVGVWLGDSLWSHLLPFVERGGDHAGLDTAGLLVIISGWCAGWWPGIEWNVAVWPFVGFALLNRVLLRP